MVRCDASSSFPGGCGGWPTIAKDDELSLFENGIGKAAPAASTPGNAPSLGKICSKNCRCFSGSGYLAFGKMSSVTRACEGSKPGFVALRLAKLLINKPAPVRSSKESATCAMTSNRRKRCDSG